KRRFEHLTTSTRRSIMSSLFKHRSVRWIDERGRRVPRGTPGARKEVEKSKYWGGKDKDKNGKVRRGCLRVKDKQCAAQALSTLEKKEERRKVGLEDRHTEHAAVPLWDHLTAWFEALENGGTSVRRREDLVGRIKKLVAAAGWSRLSDISEESAL